MGKAIDYPQETMGTTLAIVSDNHEWRRVFYREHGGLLEVGEFTRGPLTVFYFDAPVHYHCVHVPDIRLKDLVRDFFSNDHTRELHDLIDYLTDIGISVGYVDVQMGRFARYLHFEGRKMSRSA